MFVKSNGSEAHKNLTGRFSVTLTMQKMKLRIEIMLKGNMTSLEKLSLHGTVFWEIQKKLDFTKLQ